MRKEYREPLDLDLKKDALHKALDIPVDKKIPVSKLKDAADSKSALMRKRANFALNARKWNHQKKG